VRGLTPDTAPEWDGHLPWPRYPQSLCKGALPSIGGQQDVLPYVRSCQAVRIQGLAALQQASQTLCRGLAAVSVTHGLTSIPASELQLRCEVYVQQACLHEAWEPHGGVISTTHRLQVATLAWNSHRLRCFSMTAIDPQSLRGATSVSESDSGSSTTVSKENGNASSTPIQRWAVPGK
jgi:hypothetical protein